MALPDTWQGRPIRRWGEAQYEAAGESAPEAKTETGGVPEVWLDGYDLARDGDYEAAAGRDAANGRPVWESYAAGLDPTDPEAKFTVRLSFEEGKPHLAWEPDWREKGTRTYRVWGRKAMDGEEEWTDVTEGEDRWVEDGWRFFKVEAAAE